MSASVSSSPLPAPSYLFYDLETSGLSSADARIMQFAAQRTDLSFHPTEPPINLLVRLDNDTLPSPGAILTTKITPQKSLSEGIPERELAQYLMETVFTPNTIILGFNSVRFDDKFIQYLFWRNFYPPYDWMWQDGRSRWDMLDVVRMTRALRPEGIVWPFTPEGKPTNRLELITKLNNISHESAHDALSDVNALIDVTRLIQEKQPKLFSYLFRLRNKREVKGLVDLAHPAPFVYTSGRYGSTHLFTTIAYPLATGKNGSIYVYDLRVNPKTLTEENFFPTIKPFAYNKCPAVAPLSVLTPKNYTALELNQDIINEHLSLLPAHINKIKSFIKKKEATPFKPTVTDPESSLYDSFTPDIDLPRLAAIRKKSLTSSGADLTDFHPNFADDRLPDLLIHYKAKNFPDTLTESELTAWNAYRTARLSRQSTVFLSELETLSKDPAINNNPEKTFLLEELMLYYQSLIEYDN